MFDGPEALMELTRLPNVLDGFGCGVLTTVQAVPAQCAMAPLVLTAHALVALRSATPANRPTSVPVTSDHAVPFQCSNNEELLRYPPLPSTKPTAQASLALL